MTRGYLASLAQARADTSHQAEEEARASAPETTREESLLAVQLILDRLHETGIPLDDLEPIAGDDLACGECERTVLRLYVYGAFRLCRGCATRRLELAAKPHLYAAPVTPAEERAAA